jgi:hypothetical protein
MDVIVRECLKIKDYYENHYVNKSLIICNDPMFVFNMALILQKDDFPVEFLNHLNFISTIERFINGNLRMLIISDLMYEAIRYQYERLFNDVSVIFISSKTLINKNYYIETFKEQNFISLDQL